jgi:hypothetical protein
MLASQMIKPITMAMTATTIIAVRRSRRNWSLFSGVLLDGDGVAPKGLRITVNISHLLSRNFDLCV